MTVDISDERHRQSVLQAWSDYADGRKIIELANCRRWCQQTVFIGCSLMMAAQLLQNHRIMGRSFFLPKITIAHRTSRLLDGGPYEQFMASTLTADGRPYVWYDGDVWVAFYREVEVRDRLPAILAPEQVTNFGEEVQSSIGRPLAWLASCHPHQKLSHRMRLRYTT